MPLADHTSSTILCCCSCAEEFFPSSKMVGSFSRAFGGCRANFSRVRGSQANFAFNGAKARSRGKVSRFWTFTLRMKKGLKMKLKNRPRA